MLVLAYVLCALAGAALLLLTLPGRPTRGENFVGAHLVTGPVAIAFVLGSILVQVAAPLPSTAANIGLGLAWPGAIVGFTFLPLMANGGRRAGKVKAVMPLVVAAPFLLGHGGHVHATVPWVGAATLAMVGFGGAWVLVEQPLRRWRARLARSVTPQQPSEWEVQQAEWQRGEWRKLPPDAPVAALLGHARSLAPEVREACHARLAAHPTLDGDIAEALRGERPGDALWYVQHHYPRNRAVFAHPMRDLLAKLRRAWPEKMRNDPHQRPWTGDLMPALDCAIALLLAGGDVRGELQAWQRELATIPKFHGLGTGSTAGSGRRGDPAEPAEENRVPRHYPTTRRYEAYAATMRRTALADGAQ